MTKEDLLMGQLFEYTGHFNLLRRECMNISRDELVDSRGEPIGLVTGFARFLIHSNTDDCFYVFSSKYGRITILLDECRHPQRHGP